MNGELEPGSKAEYWANYYRELADLTEWLPELANAPHLIAATERLLDDLQAADIGLDDVTGDDFDDDEDDDE